MRAQAFLAASMRSDEELIRWFRERLVWNDPATVTDLLKNGLFVRLYEPQASPWAHMCCPFSCACAAHRPLVPQGKPQSWPGCGSG